MWMEIGTAWLRQIPIVQLLYGVTLAELRARPHFPASLLTLDLIDLDDIDRYLGELRRRASRATDARGGVTDGES